MITADLVFPATPPLMVHEPSGLLVWVTRPHGFITQFPRQVHADADVARFLAGPMSERVLPQTPTGSPRATIIHDWHLLLGYDTEARKIATEWGIRERAKVERIIVVLPPEDRKIVRMGISVATVALRLAGIELELCSDVREPIARLGITASSQR